MHFAYFETEFRCPDLSLAWPTEFAIITAYAPIGEDWPQARNEASDRELGAQLWAASNWVNRLTGFSPTTSHAEPGWAVDISWEAACDVGLQYHQDAIYYVIGNTLWVTYCDDRRELVRVGDFRERLHQGDSDIPVDYRSPSR